MVVTSAEATRPQGRRWTRSGTDELIPHHRQREKTDVGDWNAASRDSRSYRGAHRPSATDARAVATRDPGGDHLGLYHLRYRWYWRAAVSFRLAPEPYHRRLPVRGDPGFASGRWHPAG